MLQLTIEQELDIQIFESRLRNLNREDLEEVAEMLYRNWMVRENLLKSMLGAGL
jgi:Phycobilisome degradation protein nblA